MVSPGHGQPKTTVKDKGDRFIQIGMIHFHFLELARPVQPGKDPTDAHRNTPTIKESLQKPPEKQQRMV